MKTRQLAKALYAAAFTVAIGAGLSAPAFADSNYHSRGDSAAHAQFGYPNADSGPHGAAAAHSHGALAQQKDTATAVRVGASTGGAPARIVEDSAVLAQFGYPGGDSGPYGAAAPGDSLGSANYKLPFEEGALGGRTTGSTPKSGYAHEGPAVRLPGGR